MGDIVHAYAVVESRTQPGRFYALHLHGVIADRIEHLTPNGGTNAGAYAAERLMAAINTRTVKKDWSKP